MGATETLEAQGELQPGDQGYWKVWGARPNDIRVGDIVMTDGSEDQVAEIDRSDIVRVRIVTTTGDRFSLGALCPVIVLRWGTHNTLA